MNNKRFTYEYYEHNGNLLDNKMNTFYHIEDSDENIKILCDRLNWLVEENDELKQFKEDVFDKIDTMIAGCEQGETEVVTKEELNRLEFLRYSLTILKEGLKE